MNKLFTLTALGLLVSLSATAQKVRKTWDFREGFSTATVANLAADMEQNGTDAHWRNWEKNASDAGKYGDTYWAANSGTTVNDDNELCTVVNGEYIPIPETQGLNMKGIKAKGLILATNYPTSENESSPNGMYPYGSGFIWMNGKNLTFTINQVKKGETLRIGVESHKNTEARGINVIVNGETLAPVEGEQVPKFFNEVVYNIPDDTPDVDDYTPVQIKSTNGCHIYYMIWENIKPGTNIGDGSAYNPATVDDVDTLVTNYYINIGEWNTANPASGTIATTVKHAGPFDIVSFISNGSDGTPRIVFEVSKDSTEWTQVGDTINMPANEKRLYRKYTRSYENTDEVYVRARIAAGNSKAGFYDIYLMNHGEKSIARENELATGIEGITNATANRKATPAAIYSINGTRLSAMQRGINIVKMSNGETKKVIVK